MTDNTIHSILVASSSVCLSFLFICQDCSVPCVLLVKNPAESKEVSEARESQYNGVEVNHKANAASYLLLYKLEQPV